jgi:hypothetical protein
MTGFPGFQHVYHVRDPATNRPMRGEFESPLDTCAITRGEQVPPRSIRIRWAMGGAIPSDFIWTTSAHALVVHSRVRDLLQHHALKGWHTYSVHVSDKQGRLHRDYVGLVVTGRCSPVDLSRSVVVLKEYPGGWFPHLLGEYFDERSWDGSDVFMSQPDAAGKVTASVYLSERAREVLRLAKVRNVELQRLTEVSVMASVYEIGSRHRLPADYTSRVDAAYARARVPRPSSA